LTTSRRAVLTGVLAGVGGAVLACTPSRPDSPGSDAGPADRATAELGALERRFGGKLGLFALDTANGSTVSHRGDERFLMCSTVKTFIAATVLHRRLTEAGLLDRTIHYTPADILEWAPVTATHLYDGMTVAQLCEAMITQSDNTAANLLIATLGGPAVTQEFVRTLGDNISRMDRTETALNYPDGDKDTSTPAQLVSTLTRVALGDGLDPHGRELLTGWLKANTTGGQTIRAGVPARWTVGDKTGSGFAGQANDIAVLWPPDRAPIVIAALTAPDDRASDQGKPTIAEATRIALRELGTEPA
jgi:beta-lactamase class A